MKEANVEPAQIRGMGIGIPGQIEIGTTRVRFAPNLDWRDVDLRPLMPVAWHWPLVVENDVRMGTYGEFARGAAKGARNVFGIFVGTGVGGGLILNGELYTGFLGHAGRNRPYSFFTGERAPSSKRSPGGSTDEAGEGNARRRPETRPQGMEGHRSRKGEEFATRRVYQKDDPIAVQLVDDAARAVGAAIGSVINLLSPEVIVIGGGVTEALKETFTERVWEFAQRYILPGAARREFAVYLRRSPTTPASSDAPLIAKASSALRPMPNVA